MIQNRARGEDLGIPSPLGANKLDTLKVLPDVLLSSTEAGKDGLYQSKGNIHSPANRVHV